MLFTKRQTPRRQFQALDARDLTMEYLIRKANLKDCPAVEKLIAVSARGLSAQDYTTEQIEEALKGA